jgi:hypothetical protein
VLDSYLVSTGTPAHEVGKSDDGSVPRGGKRGRKQVRPDPAEGPVAGFALLLCKLKENAGDPSYDRMRGEFGAAASKSALSAAARGRDLPSWETTWEFVRSLAVAKLGQDEEAVRREWSEHWERAQAGSAEEAPSSSAEPASPEPPDPAESPDFAEPRPAEPQGPAEPAGRAEPPELPESTVRPRRRLPKILAAVVGIALLVGVGTIVYLHTSGPDLPIPGDASVLMEETIPDGTPVKVRQSFVKTWVIKNIGTIRWENRYLEQLEPREGTSECTAPTRVSVQAVGPGETAQLHIPVESGPKPGDCKIRWKMVDEDGNQFFPATLPVFFDVAVVP